MKFLIDIRRKLIFSWNGHPFLLEPSESIPWHFDVVGANLNVSADMSSFFIFDISKNIGWRIASVDAY